MSIVLVIQAASRRGLLGIGLERMSRCSFLLTLILIAFLILPTIGARSSLEVPDAEAACIWGGEDCLKHMYSSNFPFCTTNQTLDICTGAPSPCTAASGKACPFTCTPLNGYVENSGGDYMIYEINPCPTAVGARCTGTGPCYCSDTMTYNYPCSPSIKDYLQECGPGG